MANKIFRQVLCSERLPKERGTYIVDVKSSRFNSLIWVMTYWYDGFGNSYEPTEIEWWLEEVEMPSDDEIKQLSTAYSIKSNEGGENVPNHDLYKEYADIDFKAGFNKAIELIKGEGLNNG